MTAREMHSSQNIDVVVLSALAEEKAALLAVFGGANCAVVRGAGDDVHLVSLGTLRIAVTSVLGMGNVGASAMAREVIEVWRPRFLVLVGLAAGIRGHATDLRLGDVLVADQVVGFELAKVTADGLQRRYQSFRPHFDLLAAAHAVAAQEWASRMDTPAPDGLGAPGVHVGTVLSGEKVFADITGMEEVRGAWPAAVGVEMEGLGVALAAYRSGCGFLLVKGVSDFADAAKDDRWRGYAAEAAARFTLAVLHRRPGAPPPGSGPRQLPRDATGFTGRGLELESLLAADPPRAAMGRTAPAGHAAHRLFVRTADRPGLTTETPEVREVVELCGRLPLAICVAATRLKHRRVWTVPGLVDRVRDLEVRLAVLDDGQRSVHAALHLSYRQLPAGAQRLYRLLGLHPGPEIEPHAAAALTAGTPDEVRRWLDGLADDHLLQEPATGRYRFHDLVRAHAAGLAAAEETKALQRVALTRLLEHYRQTAATAMDLAYPDERQRHHTAPPAGAAASGLSDRDRAGLWLDTELANLLAAAHHAAENGWPEHTWQLSAILDRHLLTRGRHQEAQTLHQHALDLAVRLGRHPAEMDVLNRLGNVHWRLGRYERAGEHFARALRIAQDIGDRAGELNALNGVGGVLRMVGRHGEAAEHYRQALHIARELDSLNWEFEVLQGLGRLHHATGRPGLALTHHGQALRLATDLAQPSDQARAHDGLAHAHCAVGRSEAARRHWQHALDVLIGLGTGHTQDIEANVPSIRAHLADLDQDPPTGIVA